MRDGGLGGDQMLAGLDDVQAVYTGCAFVGSHAFERLLQVLSCPRGL
jgi:hypothetical protein